MKRLGQIEVYKSVELSRIERHKGFPGRGLYGQLWVVKDEFVKLGQ